jgi:2-polyprenyl-3-methyl-5-hydroxy-6-metoxy-1,4-benzoquinol methylase
MVFCRLATGAVVHGLDFDPVYMTDGLRSMEGIEWAESNVELDPIPWSGPFDFIVFSEVLEHLNFQAVPTLRKLVGVLRPGGRIYLSTPDASEWGETTVYHNSYAELPMPSEDLREDVVDDHVWQFSESELVQVLAESGLKTLRFAFAPGSAGERHFNLTLTPLEPAPIPQKTPRG